MSITTEQATKPGGRPAKTPTENVRLDRDIARKARVMCAALGVSLPDYLAEKLRGLVDDDYRAWLKKQKS